MSLDPDWKLTVDHGNLLAIGLRIMPEGKIDNSALDIVLNNDEVAITFWTFAGPSKYILPRGAADSMAFRILGLGSEKPPCT